ncbi:MAG: hypothetical protein J0L54_04455 [Chitinophagales bacterium]|nr:hypothetical protein [Chitinophagales bacterium]
MNNTIIGTHLYIPENINEQELLKQYPIGNYSFKDGFNLLDMFFIISRLIEVPYFNRSLRNNEGYVTLKAQYMQFFVSSYHDYITYLESAGVITIDRHFIQGQKSRGYSFLEPYLSASTLREIPVPLTARLYKRISKKENEFAISEQASKLYPYLTKWFNAELTIKFEEANQIIDLIHLLRKAEKRAIIRNTITILNSINEMSKSDFADLRKAVRPIYEYKFGLLTIRKQRWVAKIDSTVFRLHTNLTNLKSELRYCLRYQGRDLVSIDIKNCQPYLSILLFHPGFYESESRWQEFYRKRKAVNTTLKPITPITLSHNSITQSNLSFSFSHSSKYNHLITILLSEETADHESNSAISDTLTDDLNEYIRHAAEGTLYEYIGNELKIRGLTIPEERGKIKEIVFQTLFTDNRYIGQEEAEPKRIFAELFPTVARIFNLIKTSKSEILPITLQQIESELFLKRITKRVSMERPELPIFTIHDSIITKRGEEAYIESVIKNECEKAIGISPSVQIENYTDQGIEDVKVALQRQIEKAETTSI